MLDRRLGCRHLGMCLPSRLSTQRITERYQLRYWDAAIVAAAVRLGAPVLYSEDLNDGQTYDGVKVVNPSLIRA